MKRPKVARLVFAMSLPEYMVRLFGAILGNAPAGAINEKAERVRIKDRRQSEL